MNTAILKYIFGSLSLLICLPACESTVSNSNPEPARVEMTAKSADSVLVETGIDAEDPVGTEDGILVDWQLLNEDDLSHYNVYRRQGDTTGTFLKIGEVSDRSGESTFLDSDVDVNQRYYYYVAGVDESDQEGERSVYEYYTLLDKPDLNIPINGQVFNDFFDWTLSNLGSQFFAFRLERRLSGEDYTPLYVILLEAREGNVQPNQRWTRDEIGIPELAPGDYRWRIDIRNLNDDRRGAESSWGFFRQN